VVAIGGGTGLSTLLRGLKRYVATPDRRRGIRLDRTPKADVPSAAPCPELPCVIRELSAVVTVTDDGGSSGRLREDFKMLPPGDIRNCMVALSEDEHLLSKLFQFRFEQGELEGHSFGNLFVAALSHITGDFAQAVQMSSPPGPCCTTRMTCLALLRAKGFTEIRLSSLQRWLASQMDCGPVHLSIIF
jgi:2-phospho-L-lactate transferase/gluconeogenesis factor (CofD/UPF0052 family)